MSDTFGLIAGTRIVRFKWCFLRIQQTHQFVLFRSGSIRRLQLIDSAASASIKDGFQVTCAWSSGISRRWPVLAMRDVLLYDDGATEGREKKREEKSAAGRPIGSHGIVRIFTHKDGQYTNC